MAEPKSGTSKQIMDVSRPGTTAPSDTSKPVIVNNRPMLKDPIIAKTSDQVSDVPEKEAPSVGPEKGKITIEPPAKDPNQADDKDQEEVPEKAVETHDSMEDEDENDPVKQTAEQANAEAEKIAKHEAEIDKLAESKQFFLPINSIEDRKTKRFILIGVVLSLVLAVVWIDIALDAGLIKLGGLKSLTHFFQT